MSNTPFQYKLTRASIKIHPNSSFSLTTYSGDYPVSFITLDPSDVVELVNNFIEVYEDNIGEIILDRLTQLNNKLDDLIKQVKESKQ